MPPFFSLSGLCFCSRKSKRESCQDRCAGLGLSTENGKEAVDIVSRSVSGRFDFIFMDIMMPVMDGLEAARQIRTLNRKDTKEIPIISMTANAFAEDVQVALNAGMDDHVAKPIDMGILISVITKYIE